MIAIFNFCFPTVPRVPRVLPIFQITRSFSVFCCLSTWGLMNNDRQRRQNATSCPFYKRTIVFFSITSIYLVFYFPLDVFIPRRSASVFFYIGRAVTQRAAGMLAFRIYVNSLSWENERKAGPFIRIATERNEQTTEISVFDGGKSERAFEYLLCTPLCVGASRAVVYGGHFARARNTAIRPPISIGCEWWLPPPGRSETKKEIIFFLFFFSASPFLLSSRNSWANLGLLCPSIERRRQVTGQTKIYKENTQRGEHNGRLPLSLKTSRVGILLTLCARGWWPRTYRNNTPVIIKDPFFPLSSSSSDYRYFSFSSRHGLIIQSADALWIFLCIYLLRSNR